MTMWKTLSYAFRGVTWAWECACAVALQAVYADLYCRGRASGYSHTASMAALHLSKTLTKAGLKLSDVVVLPSPDNTPPQTTPTTVN